MTLQDSIQSILTLRYDIHRSPFYTHKTRQDFEPYGEPEIGWVQETKERLEVAIRNELSQYDTIGISLSGGIDSTLLLGMLRTIYPKKKIEAVHDTSSGEEESVIKLCEKYNITLTLENRQSIISNIPKYVEIAQEPRWNVYHHIMARLCKMRNCDVMITGDGADELFGGYIFRYKKYFELDYESPTQKYLDCHINDWVEDQEDVFVNGRGLMKKIEDHFRPYWGEKSERIYDVYRADYNGKLLHDFLPVSSKISKYHGIPIVAPFMELRDWATHIPSLEKINFQMNEGKMILRKLLKEYNLPVPQKKVGYTVPMVEDFRYNEEIYHKLMKNIPDTTWDYINKDWLIKHKSEREDQRVINKFLQILAVGYFLRGSNKA